jgi:hypothetical protein
VNIIRHFDILHGVFVFRIAMISHGEEICVGVLENSGCFDDATEVLTRSEESVEYHEVVFRV